MQWLLRPGVRCGDTVQQFVQDGPGIAANRLGAAGIDEGIRGKAGGMVLDVQDRAAVVEVRDVVGDAMFEGALRDGRRGPNVPGRAVTVPVDSGLQDELGHWVRASLVDG